MSAAVPLISLLGTSALLFEAPGPTELETQRLIWALAREAATWPEVDEAVPGMNNMLVSFSTPPRDLGPLRERLTAAWAAAEPLPLAGRTVELPVIYGGEGGPHMADVMAHTGLSAEEIATIHSTPAYPVYALGSHPGYCYLGGMDPRIATPRRKVPCSAFPAERSPSAARRPASQRPLVPADGTRSARRTCASSIWSGILRRCWNRATASSSASRR